MGGFATAFIPFLFNFTNANLDTLVPAQSLFGPAAFLTYLWMKRHYGTIAVVSGLIGRVRAPATEDQSGQGDVPVARRDAGLELPLPGDEPDPADAGDRTAEDDVDVARANDVDAHGGRGVGVLTHGAHAQSPAGFEEREASAHAPPL